MSDSLPGQTCIQRKLLTRLRQFCRLGFLAVAQGNGEVSIFNVPHPEEALSQRHKLRKGKGPPAQDASAADRLMEIAPCASAPAEALSGSLASCLEWLPSQPNDLLLVACPSQVPSQFFNLPDTKVTAPQRH